MPETYVPSQQVRSDRLGAGHITAIVLGVILAITGIGSLTGAGVLGWANATQRDSNGYFSTAMDRFVSSTYAIIGVKSAAVRSFREHKSKDSHD